MSMPDIAGRHEFHKMPLNERRVYFMKYLACSGNNFEHAAMEFAANERFQN